MIKVAELDKPLDSAVVRQRKQGGRKLSYIESWHAIQEANRIFGHLNWNRQTLKMELVQAEQKAKENDNAESDQVVMLWYISYIAQVAVEVFEGDKVTYRMGTGFGQGQDRDLGKAHESASKEAESDAMKRALMTFGNPFGLALYDKEQANVMDVEQAKKLAKATALKTWNTVWSGSDLQAKELRENLKKVKPAVDVIDFILDCTAQGCTNLEEVKLYGQSIFNIPSLFTTNSDAG